MTLSIGISIELGLKNMFLDKTDLIVIVDNLNAFQWVVCIRL